MSELTEEEQLERLKRWWQQYGRAIVLGVVIGGAGIFGGYHWQDSKRETAEAASAVFEQAMNAADASDLTILVQQFGVLRDTHPESPYVTQAGLRLAALYLQRGESDEAQEMLEAMLAREKGGALEPLVASRLARVLIYRGDASAALGVIDATSAGTYAPLLSEIRGDAHVALDQKVEARRAYQAALDDPGQPQLVDTAMLDMKIAQLPPADVTAAEAP